MKSLRRLTRMATLCLAMTLLTTLAHAQSGDDQAENQAPAKRSVNAIIMKKLHDSARDMKLPAPPFTTDTLMNGPHKLHLRVFDAATSKPIQRYSVSGQMKVTISAPHHCAMPGETEINDWRIVTAEEQSKIKEGKERRPSDEITHSLSIGQLEDQEVNNAEGACTYERLGPVDFELIIQAKGYVGERIIHQKPADGSDLEVKLNPVATITGRVIAKETGRPVEGAEVSLQFPDDEGGGFQSLTLDGDGIFIYEGLPPGKYRLSAKPKPDDMSGLNNQAERLARQRLNATDKSTSGSFETLRRERLGQGCLLPGTSGVINLPRGGTVNVGDIVLEPAPRLDLELSYENKVPLGNFPFEVCIENGERYQDRTDDEGKASIALAGFRPGRRVTVYVPSNLNETYQVREIEPPARDPLETFGDEAKHQILNKVASQNQIFPQDRPLTLSDLNAEQRAEYERAVEQDKEERRQAAAKFNNRPEHPNARVLHPEPGQVCQVRMVYHPVQNETDLVLRFRDGLTGQPVANVAGVVCEGNGYVARFLSAPVFEAAISSNGDAGKWAFHTDGADGQAILPSFSPSKRFLNEIEEEKRLLAGEPVNAMPPSLEGKKAGQLCIVVCASGYTKQMFEVPYEEATKGQPLTFDLEPEAVVTGRVLFAPTGAPLTSDSLRTALQQAGRLSPAIEKELASTRPENPIINMRFNNEVLEGRREMNYDESHYAHIAFVRFGPDGRFRITGLRPDAHWTAVIDPLKTSQPEERIMPGWSKRDIVLQPGVNDLGDIVISLAGRLKGYVTDEDGKPVEGARINFPGDTDQDSHEPAVTDHNGRYEIDLSRLQDGNRQVIRVLPPWGYTAERPDADLVNEMHIACDAMREIDQAKGGDLAIKLNHGHTLRIEVPASSATLALAHRKRDEAAKSQPPYFRGELDYRFTTVRLQELKADPTGFASQHVEWIPEGVAPSSTQTLTLSVAHVPPGRYALSLEGGVVAIPEGRDDPAIRRNMAAVAYNTSAAYAEFEMGPTTTTVRLAPALNEVNIALNGWNMAPNQKAPDTLVFLERAEPLSTLHSEQLRGVLNSVVSTGGRDPWSLRAPMIGYSNEGDNWLGRDGAMQAHFMGVPAGRYHLQAYASLQEATGRDAKPYYEQFVEVKDGTRPVRLTVPWQGAAKNLTNPTKQ